MSIDREAEIETCLVYTVLRSPDPWIGGPSTEYLQAFLSGALCRLDYVQSALPKWRVSGVLDNPAFYKQFVSATGHPTLTIRWATALAMTHHSFAEGFAKLRDEAFAWHRANGVAEPRSNTGESFCRSGDAGSRSLWNELARRPAMFFGDSSGWMLYCFLNRMQKGGDWLCLSPMPGLDTVFGGISARSQKSYGSPFAAFRVYDAQGLLEWIGLPDNETCVSTGPP